MMLNNLLNISNKRPRLQGKGERLSLYTSVKSLGLTLRWKSKKGTVLVSAASSCSLQKISMGWHTIRDNSLVYSPVPGKAAKAKCVQADVEIQFVIKGSH